MTAETTAATDTGTTNAEATTTTDAATQSTTPPGSGDTPPATTTTDNAETATTSQDGEGDDGNAGGVPETYELTMPEGMELDSALLEKATPVFKEIGLTNEQASKLASVYADHIKSMGEGSADKAEQWRAQRNAQELADQQQADMDALKADKEVGGANFEPVKKQVMDFVGTLPAEFRQMIDTKGLGNNPEFVRAIHRAIHYMPQDTGERPAGGGGARPTDIAERMFGR